VAKDGSNYVSSWADQSGNGTNWTPSLGNPLWVSNARNGLPVLRASGSYLAPQQLSQPSFLAGSSAGEVFVVLKGSAGPPDYNFGWGGFGASTSLHSLWPWNTGDIYDNFGIADGRSGPHAVDALVYGIFNVAVASTGPGNWSWQSYSELGHTSGVDETYTVGWLSPNFFLFRDSWDSNQFIGDIGELLVYDQVLSSGDRQTTIDYLRARWSI
jgi:hypothetical protein